MGEQPLRRMLLSLSLRKQSSTRMICQHAHTWIPYDSPFGVGTWGGVVQEVALLLASVFAECILVVLDGVERFYRRGLTTWSGRST